jgi:hypothetical protein
VVERWNKAIASGRDIWWSPTIRAAIVAGMPWADVHCPGCRTSRSLDLRIIDRHPLASVGGLVLGCGVPGAAARRPCRKITGLQAVPPLFDAGSGDDPVVQAAACAAPEGGPSRLGRRLFQADRQLPLDRGDRARLTGAGGRKTNEGPVSPPQHQGGRGCITDIASRRFDPARCPGHAVPIHPEKYGCGNIID